MGWRTEPGKGAGARDDREPLVWITTPCVGQAELFGAKLDRRRAVARAVVWTTGNGRSEPHGCGWLKHTTGFGEEQTARVVGNGEGGPKRVWKPATRRGGPDGSFGCWRSPSAVRAAGGTPNAVRAAGGTPSREVDSPDWEHRRGERPHGRRFRDGRTVVVHRTDGEGRGRGRDPRG
jgi:hypothetical protein